MSGAPDRTDLLLIGKTGNGKSSTGNSILGRKAFHTSANTASDTKKIKLEYSEFQGRIIKVVDSPGVGDTNLNDREALNLVVQSMQQAIALNSLGYHAFLLVFRLGVRLTREEVQTVHLLRSIFGKDFIEKFVIIVLTFGDTFDPEEAGVTTFEEWCLKQTGTFQDLLQECGNRVVLFDNRTRDEGKQREQREKLLAMVDGLNLVGQRYSDDHFKMAQEERDRVIVETNIPIISEEAIMESSLIIQQLGQVKLDQLSEQLPQLHALKSRAACLVQSIVDQDKGTGALQGILSNAQHIMQSIDQQISYIELVIQHQVERERSARELDELRAERDHFRSQQQEAEREGAERKMNHLQQEENERLANLEMMRRILREDNDQLEREHDDVSGENNDWLVKVAVSVLGVLARMALKVIFKM